MMPFKIAFSLKQTKPNLAQFAGWKPLKNHGVFVGRSRCFNFPFWGRQSRRAASNTSIAYSNSSNPRCGDLFNKKLGLNKKSDRILEFFFGDADLFYHPKIYNFQSIVCLNSIFSLGESRKVQNLIVIIINSKTDGLILDSQGLAGRISL